MPADPLPVLLDALGWRWERVAAAGPAVAVLDADNRHIAYLYAQVTDGLAVDFAVGHWAGYDRNLAATLVAAIVTTARQLPVGRARVYTVDPLARFAARRAGFTGPLRQPLTLDVGEAVGAGPPHPGELARELEDLLPGLRITPGRPPGLVRKVVQRAANGVGPRIRLDVVGPTGPLRVLVPARDDVITEAVAMAVDTAMAIKGRFPELIAGVRTVSFDLGERGMSSNHIAGVANTTVAAVQLNAAYCCADLLPGLLYAVRDQPTSRASALTAAEYRIDKVTAHELGHYFDLSFQASCYADSIELRRQLGRVLGVETLEMAVRGDIPEARARLARELSPYATTNTLEAIAELFAMWWFGGSDCGPLVQRFDELVEEYFPTPG